MNEERAPALIEIEQAAAQHNVDFLVDDEFISLGHQHQIPGVRSMTNEIQRFTALLQTSESLIEQATKKT
jgi:hypothetical protein